MRTREEIEQRPLNRSYNENDLLRKLTLEVLLDIRDLLESNNKKVQYICDDIEQSH